MFGHDPRPATLSLVPRSTAWRATRAARFAVIGAVLAPVVAILPPHAPWAVAAGAGGAVLALRKWRERYTLVALDGECPRCDRELATEGVGPLREPHRVSCEGCGNPVEVRVEASALPSA